MVASKIIEPVMRVRNDDPEGIEELGFRIKNTGMYKYPDDFPNIPIIENAFGDKVAKLHLLNDTCKGNSNLIQKRNELALDVYNDESILLMYCKPICKGSVDLTQKSGFDSNIIPSAHTLAPQAVIKKIVKGPGFNTIKVSLMKASGPETGKRENRSFLVYQFDGDSGKLIGVVCVSTDSRKLIVENVEVMKPYYYSVSIKNAAGENELSSKVKFTLTD